MNGNFAYAAILSNDIELTFEQENEMEAIKLVEGEQNKSRVKIQQQLRLELLKLMQEDALNQRKARKISEKLTRLEKENVKSKKFAANQLMSLLTPEQCSCLESTQSKCYRHAFVSCGAGKSNFA
jgi:Spy/CpxP family protein refolding chaperone